MEMGAELLGLEKRSQLLEDLQGLEQYRSGLTRRADRSQLLQS